MDFDDQNSEEFDEFRSPLPADDRIWRHPSEIRFEDPTPATPVTSPSAKAPSVWTATLLSGVISAIFTLGLVAAVGGLGMEIVEQPVQTATQRVAVPAAAVPTTRAPGALTVIDIAERFRPAIARVDVVGPDGASSGSAVLFRDDGHLMTNAHVVADATEIIVILEDGRVLDADLVGADPQTDVAVIRVEGSDFPTAVLGSATELKVGQEAITIGSPLGLEGGPSVTTGVVSALRRRIDTPSGTTLHDMIQFDAPIAPGSSGGALLDSNGSVIGITTAIAVSDVGAEGLGFATPIDIARKVADDIIASGRAVHVWLGILGSDLPREAATGLGVKGGATVIEVVPDSPADSAGLLVDDHILSIDGESVPSMSGLVVSLRTRDVGDVVDLIVSRDGELREVSVVLTERPGDV